MCLFKSDIAKAELAVYCKDQGLCFDTSIEELPL